MLNRRVLVASLAAAVMALTGRAKAALEQSWRVFVEAAFVMKKQAVESGDQAYGAVVVRGDEIVGYGPSRVVIKNDHTAHAEREAIRDAQARLGRSDLSDCAMYSTSRPCSECEQAAAQVRLSRMYAGVNATDLGPPRVAR